MTKAVRNLTIALWGLLVVLALAVVAWGPWLRRPLADVRENDLHLIAQSPRVEAPIDAVVSDFALTDQNSQPFTNSSMRGKVWIVDFIFTHCKGPCPAMTGQMAAMTKKVTGPSIRFLSFSVDPSTDTPEVLKQYAKDMGADENVWTFLTGDQKSIYAVAAQMKIGASPADANSPITHGTWFSLVGPDAKVHGYYRQDEPESLKQLVIDAQKLARDGHL